MNHDGPTEATLVAPFDSVALEYDATFTETPLGRRQRAIVHRHLSRVVRSEHRVLELNCGTGEDAVWLAQRVAQVVATDISTAMIAVAEQKAKSSGCTNITFHQRDIAALSNGNTGNERGRFDLILSNFDGLNCLNDIAWLPDQFQSLLNPGGHVVLVFMNPVCAMEMAYFLGTARFSRMFTRLDRSGSSAHIGNDQHLRTYFHPVHRVATSFRSDYTIQRVEAVGLLTPPTLMRDFYHRHEKWFRRLHRLEDALAPLPPFNRLGDHVMLHVQLRDH